jgi:1-acyl-sn-glycerol-3-phosphate acyltransferase
MDYYWDMARKLARHALSVTFYVYWTIWTTIISAPIPILWILNDPKLVRRMSRVYSRGILVGLKYIVGLNYREIGIENILPGPVIYACNHQSAWETLVFNILVNDVAIVLKRSLYRFPVVGWYLRKSPMIAIDRTAGALAMKELIKQSRLVKQTGRSLLIFPEGTRLPVHSEGEYHLGVGMLYKSLGVPVIPVATNSGLFWPLDGYVKLPGKITVSYMPRIEPGLDLSEFMKRMRTLIEAEKNRLAYEARQDWKTE